jgi:hypothetical protein
MNEDDIIRLAQEAGWRVDSEGEILEGDGWHIQTDIVERFAKLVAAAERQACIQLLEDFSQTQMVPVKDTWRMGLIAGAHAIRARDRNNL